MTDFDIKDSSVQDFEATSKVSMDGYEKYRLKADEMTIDVSLVDLTDRSAEDYIKQRKDELTSSDTEVPHPYKPEKQQKTDAPSRIEFGADHGKGTADSEFNLVDPDSDAMNRYDYLVYWRKVQEGEALAEIEVYAYRGDHEKERLLDIAKSVEVEETDV